MDEHHAIIPQAPPAGTGPPHHSPYFDLGPLTAAIAGLGGKLDATNAKIDAANAAVDTVADQVTKLSTDVEKINRNLNGDGSPKDRGWAGLIEDLRSQLAALRATVDLQGGKLNMAWNLANSVGLILFGWWINKGGGHGGPP